MIKKYMIPDARSTTTNDSGDAFYSKKSEAVKGAKRLLVLRNRRMVYIMKYPHYTAPGQKIRSAYLAEEEWRMVDGTPKKVWNRGSPIP